MKWSAHCFRRCLYSQLIVAKRLGRTGCKIERVRNTIPAESPKATRTERQSTHALARITAHAQQLHTPGFFSQESVLCWRIKKMPLLTVVCVWLGESRKTQDKRGQLASVLKAMAEMYLLYISRFVVPRRETNAGTNAHPNPKHHPICIVCVGKAQICAVGADCKQNMFR